MKKAVVLASLVVMTFNIWGMIPNYPDGSSGNNNKRRISQISENSEENDRNMRSRTSQQSENLSMSRLISEWSFDKWQTLIRQWMSQRKPVLSEEQQTLVLEFLSVVKKDIDHKVFEHVLAWKHQHPHDSSALMDELVEGKRLEWLNKVKEAMNVYENLLFFSAEHDFLNLAKYLVEEKGWDVNEKNTWGGTPLFVACENGNLNMIEYLVEKGAEIDVLDEAGVAALQRASYRGNLDVVQCLVDLGANVDVVVDNDEEDVDGETPLFWACEGKSFDVVKYLVEHGADVNKENEYGETPLFKACYSGNENIVKYLVEQGAGVNKESEDEETPLFFACLQGHENIVKYLVEHGADVNKATDSGETPLHIARKKGYENIVRYLVEHGAE